MKCLLLSARKFLIYEFIPLSVPWPAARPRALPLLTDLTIIFHFFTSILGVIKHQRHHGRFTMQ